MSILRSEDMGYFTLFMPHESAWAVLNQIGKIGALQFVDLNVNQSVFNRPYAAYVKRCDEVERRLKFIENEQKRFGIEINSEDNPQTFLKRFDQFLGTREAPPSTYLEELEADMEQQELLIISQLDSHEKLLKHHAELQEHRSVLLKTQDFFVRRMGSNNLFSSITGVIRKSDILRFKRSVWRASRGNALTEIFEVDEPFTDIKTNEKVQKCVFLILYQEGSTGALSRRLTRISDMFGGQIFQVPANSSEFEVMRAQNEQEIAQASTVLRTSQQKVTEILEEFATPRAANCPSLITEYKSFILKEKAIYYNLDMFQQKGTMFYGECWCPLSLLGAVRTSMAEMDFLFPNLAKGELKEYDAPGKWPKDKTPPSYFNLNEFTASFQEIIDTYGKPNYKEANPTLFSIFTFPFLFGMMFGDIGHGSLMTAFAIYLCLYKDTIGRKNFLYAALPARYLLLLMGTCSMYMGFIYNDFLSIPTNFFGTNWTTEPDGQQTSSGPYPFGMDPEWYGSDYNLVFFNSFKMKVSVIFGVTQMICGTLFRGSNTIQQRSIVDFFFEFIPQLIFMVSIFGYMICMIFVKWNIDWSYNWEDKAPNLITVLMNMFLKMGSLDDQEPLWGDHDGQEKLQFFLLLLGLIQVPLMLLPKPFILRYQHQKRQGNKRYENLVTDQEEEEAGEEFSFGEVVIHQVIETIEFVLGAVSNTASYLRLWALSLAHAQLSEVFFEKAIIGTIETQNPVAAVVGFFIFANITVGVLMMMDAMECFLHALRLHWVEFMNKFYKGEGKNFEPLSFVTVLQSGKLPTAAN